MIAGPDLQYDGKALPPLILLGAGGHAKVVLSLLSALGRHVIGICDPALAAAGGEQWRGWPVLGDDSAIELYDCETTELAMGIGPALQWSHRSKLFDRLVNRGFRFPALIHPSALVDESCVIGAGVQIMAGAIIQPDCVLGRNTVVNTRASVDHDGEIGSDVHIAPGAILCGGVKIGDGAFIGASATLLPNINLGVNSLVAAGSTLARSLADGEVYKSFHGFKATSQHGFKED